MFSLAWLLTEYGDADEGEQWYGRAAEWRTRAAEFGHQPQ